MAAHYTHSFQFKMGNQDIEGEVEFNQDGILSYKTDNPIANLTLQQAEVLNRLFTQLKEVFNAYGSIIKIKVEKK